MRKHTGLLIYENNANKRGQNLRFENNEEKNNGRKDAVVGQTLYRTAIDLESYTRSIPPSDSLPVDVCAGLIADPNVASSAVPRGE
jgi:hypothetical protein